MEEFSRLACMAMMGFIIMTQTVALETLLDLTQLPLFNRQETATSVTPILMETHDDSTNRNNTHDCTDETATEGAVDKIPKQYIVDKKYKIQLFQDSNETLKARDFSLYRLVYGELRYWYRVSFPL